MITELLRGLPLVLMVGGGMKVLGKSSRFTNGAQKVIVQNEISDILKVIHLDSIDGPTAVPTPQNFGEYMKRNMKVSNLSINRDVSRDLWQTPYQMEQRENRIYVRSAGPDRQWNTTDDISGGVDLF